MFATITNFKVENMGLHFLTVMNEVIREFDMVIYLKFISIFVLILIFRFLNKIRLVDQ